LTPENIRRGLGARASFGNKCPTVNFAPELPEELRVYVPFQPMSHIYRLFLSIKFNKSSMAEEMVAKR